MECICKKQIHKTKLWVHLNNTCELVRGNDELKIKTFLTLYSVFDLTKLEDLIKTHYIEEQCSITDLIKYLQMGRRECERALTYFNISSRGFAQNATKNRQNKTEKTSLLKYGVTNVSKLESTKQKKVETFKKRYGVNNVYQSEEFKKYQQSIMIERYGVLSLPNRYGNKNKWWSRFSKQERQEMTENWRNGSKLWWESLTKQEQDKQIQIRFESLIKNGNKSYKSKLEDRVQLILDKLNISYKSQFFLDRKSFDFILIKSQVVLEINGDFWHANPLKYLPEDLIYDNKLASDIWEYDFLKVKLAENQGFKLVILWESDLNKMTDNELSTYLEELSNVDEN